MELAYAIPGAAALIEWCLAAGLYVAGRCWPRPGFSQVGDSLALGGMVTALAGLAWLAWDVSPELAFARSSLVTGLAVAALAVYAVLAGRRAERLSAFLILGFAIPAQAYAVGRLGWRSEVIPHQVFGPVWLALSALTGLVGAGALAVGTVLVILALISEKAPGRFPALEGSELPALQGRAVRLALVALSASLALDSIRSWWGLGQLMTGGFVWSLTAWLLLAAGVVGLMQKAFPRRLYLALLVLAFVAAIGGLVTMVQ